MYLIEGEKGEEGKWIKKNKRPAYRRRERKEEKRGGK